MSTRTLLVALVATFLTTSVGAGAARACSVCLAGDPRFSEQGATVQQRGDVSFYFQVQGFRKESASLEEEGSREKSDDQRFDLFVSASPLDRLTLTVDLPWARNEIEETSDEGTQTNRLDGLGDVSLMGSFVLWRNRDVLPTTWIEGRAFLKAPTGRTGRRRSGEVDAHLQSGTGSWDFGGGLAVVHRLAFGSLYTSLFYRENEEGDFDGLDYEYGDTLLWNAALEVPVGHAIESPELDWLTLGSELNFRFAESDRADGERYRDSGGSVLYASPTVRIRLPFRRARPPFLRAGVQIPLTSAWLNGDQKEREVWSVGLLVPF